jgi:hypothetical protein
LRPVDVGEKGFERAHALGAFRERGALPDELVRARPRLAARAREMKK